MLRSAPLSTSLALGALALAAAACHRQTPAASNTVTAAPTAAPMAPASPPATGGVDAQPGAYSPAGTSPTNAGTYPPVGTGGMAAGAGGGGMRGPGARALNLPLPQFQTRFRQRLMRADTNGDGRISLQEWTAWRASRPRQGPVDPARQFQGFDRNRDGFITPDEIDARSSRIYARRTGTGGRPGPGAGMAGAQPDTGMDADGDADGAARR